MISNIGYNFSSIFIVTFLSTCKICTETSIITASISFDVADIVSSQLKNKIKIFLFHFQKKKNFLSYTIHIQAFCNRCVLNLKFAPNPTQKPLHIRAHTYIYIYNLAEMQLALQFAIDYYLYIFFFLQN